MDNNIAKGNQLTFFNDKHFEYDRFSNLITEKRGKNQSLVTHYEYDCRHRLIKVIKPTGMIITYTYYPFNRRTSKTVNGKTTEFIWQGSKLIAETDNDTHWQSYIYEPDSFRPLVLIKGNAQQDKIQRYWYQNDQLGTPIRLTDSIGETLYQCEYDAYGQVIDEKYYYNNIDTLPDNPLRFQGQYYDEETGLHYNCNRYYDPLVGRYITQDPIKLIGSINFYQYCPNPVNWIDPLGFKGMPGAAKQTNKAKPNDTANATKPDEILITQEEFDKIINTSKGDRPENVLEYLPEEYVKAHEALFEQQGGSFIIIESAIAKNKFTFFPTRKFVGLSSEMEQIVAEYKTAGNDWRILSKRLALGDKDLTDIHIYLIRIKPGDPRFSYKMPNGKEAGAWDGEWIPVDLPRAEFERRH